MYQHTALLHMHLSGQQPYPVLLLPLPPLLLHNPMQTNAATHHAAPNLFH
jgi:hypothetical protein